MNANTHSGKRESREESKVDLQHAQLTHTKTGVLQQHRGVNGWPQFQGGKEDWLWQLWGAKSW